MKKKIYVVLLAFVFSFFVYAEDKPVEFIYSIQQDRVEYDTQSLSGLEQYKGAVQESMETSKLDVLGDLRTVVTLQTPLSQDETLDFFEKQKIKPEQVVIYSVDSQGLLATSMLVDPTKELITSAFETLSIKGNDIIGTVAFYAFIPFKKIKEIQQDERVYLADFTGDGKLHSLRSKVLTNREKSDQPVFAGELHHVAWTLYQNKGKIQ
jgi:hypothetical protein